MVKRDNIAADPDGGATRPRFWSNLTYTTRLTVSFAAIAAMTALVAIGVLSFVWEQHFQAYTEANLKNTASSIASGVARQYAEHGGYYDPDGSVNNEVTSSARYVYENSKGVGIVVYDTVNHQTIWDSTLIDTSSDEGGNSDGQAQVPTGVDSDAQSGDVPADDQAAGGTPQGDATDAASGEQASGQADQGADAKTNILKQSLKPSDNYVEVPIKVDNEKNGSVSVWVYGSNTLLLPQDVEFREKSYQAMFFAAAIAIILALCIGFLFARNLVRPINRMTKTAKAIKEGDMSARTEMHGDDEISRLGETFDEMAESVEKDRELERRLTTDVAHELRTPLMAIQSTVEAMVDGVFEADTERLETVNSEVQRLSRLVDALLKLSRLENRSTPMKEEVVDVGSLIAGIVSTHDAFVNDSGLSMEFHAQPGVYVYGDADMIRQATANLISNAVRYTPEGGHITVNVKKGDIMASIAVKDTGIGLSPEEAKMVFSRFWRADAGRNRESGGLGVGLAVVKEIVDRHGGWVHVEGKPNEGATFTIYIPLYDENRVKNRAKNKEKSKSRPKK